jgi:hypothetical protein
MRGERDEDHGEDEDLPPQIAELAQASVPNSVRGIRACKRCGILKTIEQFINEGCENCPFLEMVSFAVLKITASSVFVTVTLLMHAIHLHDNLFCFTGRQSRTMQPVHYSIL